MNELQKNFRTSLPLAPISKPEQLLGCRLLQKQVEEHGREPVQWEIMNFLQRAAIALGVEINKNELVVLSNELMDMYPTDSVEDIREALRKGRRGQYGHGMHNRRKLSLPLIRDWMSAHLDEKSQAKEKVWLEQKHAKPEAMEKVLSNKVKKMLDEFHESRAQRLQERVKQEQIAREKASATWREKRLRDFTRLCGKWSISVLQEALEIEKREDYRCILQSEIKKRE